MIEWQVRVLMQRACQQRVKLSKVGLQRPRDRLCLRMTCRDLLFPCLPLLLPRLLAGVRCRRFGVFPRPRHLDLCLLSLCRRSGLLLITNYVRDNREDSVGLPALSGRHDDPNLQR